MPEVIIVMKKTLLAIYVVINILDAEGCMQDTKFVHVCMQRKGGTCTNFWCPIFPDKICHNPNTFPFFPVHQIIHCKFIFQTKLSIFVQLIPCFINIYGFISLQFSFCVILLLRNISFSVCVYQIIFLISYHWLISDFLESISRGHVKKYLYKKPYFPINTYLK